MKLKTIHPTHSVTIIASKPDTIPSVLTYLAEGEAEANRIANLMRERKPACQVIVGLLLTLEDRDDLTLTYIE